MFDPRGVPAPLRSDDDALGARLEDAGLTSSQPPQQAIYDGWLAALLARQGEARAIGQCDRRRRELALDAKLAEVEAFYQRVALPCLYRITPFCEPPALDRVLQDAGYIAMDESRVMAAALQSESLARPARPLRDVGASEFAGIAGALRGSDRRRSRPKGSASSAWRCLRIFSCCTTANGR